MNPLWFRQEMHNLNLTLGTQRAGPQASQMPVSQDPGGSEETALKVKEETRCTPLGLFPHCGDFSIRSIDELKALYVDNLL